MDRHSKEQLLAWLNAIQNSFVIGTAAVFAFEHEECWDILENGQIGFHPREKDWMQQPPLLVLEVGHVSESLRDESLRPKLIFDFREFIFRHAVTEAFERIKTYCGATGQSDLLLDTDWYNFTRLIRNAVTHDGILRFDKRARPPVSFAEWRLEERDEGKNLQDLKIPTTAAVPLLAAMHSFAQDVAE